MLRNTSSTLIKMAEGPPQALSGASLPLISPRGPPSPGQTTPPPRDLSSPRPPSAQLQPLSVQEPRVELPRLQGDATGRRQYLAVPGAVARFISEKSCGARCPAGLGHTAFFKEGKRRNTTTPGGSPGTPERMTRWRSTCRRRESLGCCRPTPAHQPPQVRSTLCAQGVERQVH